MCKRGEKNCVYLVSEQWSTHNNNWGNSLYIFATYPNLIPVEMNFSLQKAQTQHKACEWETHKQWKHKMSIIFKWWKTKIAIKFFHGEIFPSNYFEFVRVDAHKSELSIMFNNWCEAGITIEELKGMNGNYYVNILWWCFMRFYLFKTIFFYCFDIILRNITHLLYEKFNVFWFEWKKYLWTAFYYAVEIFLFNFYSFRDEIWKQGQNTCLWKN